MQGWTILYGLGAFIIAAALVMAFVKWRQKKANEAQQALGRAITISSTMVLANPVAGTSEPTFSSEKERHVNELFHIKQHMRQVAPRLRVRAARFDKGPRARKLGGRRPAVQKPPPPCHRLAPLAPRLDRLQPPVHPVQERHAASILEEIANLRLAKVYEKQGKKKEAADLLFNLVDASRKAKGPDNLPLPTSSAAREAADQLRKLDPDRYAQLPAENNFLAG